MPSRSRVVHEEQPRRLAVVRERPPFDERPLRPGGQAEAGVAELGDDFADGTHGLPRPLPPPPPFQPAPGPAAPRTPPAESTTPGGRWLSGSARRPYVPTPHVRPCRQHGDRRGERRGRGPDRLERHGATERDVHVCGVHRDVPPGNDEVLIQIGAVPEPSAACALFLAAAWAGARRGRRPRGLANPIQGVRPHTTDPPTTRDRGVPTRTRRAPDATAARQPAPRRSSAPVFAPRSVRRSMTGESLSRTPVHQSSAPGPPARPRPRPRVAL